VIAEVKDSVVRREKRDNVFNKKRAEIHELFAPLVKDKEQLSKQAMSWQTLVSTSPELQALQYANSKQQFDQIRERLNASGKNVPYNTWLLYQAFVKLHEVEMHEAERDKRLAEIDKEEASVPIEPLKDAEKPLVEQPILANDPVFRQEYLT